MGSLIEVGLRRCVMKWIGRKTRAVAYPVQLRRDESGRAGAGAWRFGVEMGLDERRRLVSPDRE
jgi:hypothetical protein